MGLHGIVMESMKMTHVYTTKIHDIFWDRMRLTAYIYMDVSPLWNTIKTMNSINQWTLQWPYHQNKISWFFIRAISLEIYIYVIYSKSHDLNCGDHLGKTHHFPTHSPRKMVRRWCPTPASRVAPSPRRWSAKRHDRRTFGDFPWVFCMFTREWIWVNYNDLTATSLESWWVRGIIPKWH